MFHWTLTVGGWTSSTLKQNHTTCVNVKKYLEDSATHKLTAGYPKWWFGKGNSLQKWQFWVSMLDFWGVDLLVLWTNRKSYHPAESTTAAAQRSSSLVKNWRIRKIKSIIRQAKKYTWISIIIAVCILSWIILWMYLKNEWPYELVAFLQKWSICVWFCGPQKGISHDIYLRCWDERHMKHTFPPQIAPPYSYK